MSDVDVGFFPTDSASLRIFCQKSASVFTTDLGFNQFVCLPVSMIFRHNIKAPTLEEALSGSNSTTRSYIRNGLSLGRLYRGPCCDCFSKPDLAFRLPCLSSSI